MIYRMIMTLVDLYWVVLSIVGLYMSFIGYKKSVRRAAFMLFMVYFAVSLYAHTLERPVMRWFAAGRLNNITQEQLEQHAKMERETMALHLKYPGVSPYTVISYFSFPVGHTLLVAGIWMLVRRKDGDAECLSAVNRRRPDRPPNFRKAGATDTGFRTK